MALREILLPWDRQPEDGAAALAHPWQYAVVPTNRLGVIGTSGITGNNENAPFSLVSPYGRTVDWRPNTSTVTGEFYFWTTGDIDVGSNASFIAVIAGTDFGAVPEAFVQYGGPNWGLKLNLKATSVVASYVDNPTTGQFNATLSSLPTLGKNTFRAIGLTKSGSTVKAFSMGRSASTSGGNGGIRRSAGYGIGYSYDSSYGRAALIALSPTVLPDSLMLEITSSPEAAFAGIFEPRRIFVPVASTGGSTYNVDLTETGSPTDIAAGLAVFARSASESASPTDAPSSLLVAVVSVSEPASASDSAASAAVFPRSVSESGSASDTVATGSAAYNVDVTEAASAADAASAIAALVAAASESLSAADSFTGVAVFGRSVSESASATDATNWGSTTYNVDVSESASLADAVAAALQALGTIAEAASATDTPAVLIVAGATVLEPAAAAEVVAGTKQMLALLTEAGAAADSVQGVTGQVYAKSIAEAAAAGDLVAATLVPAGTFERVPELLVLHGRPRDRTISLSKPARSIGALLREQ